MKKIIAIEGTDGSGKNTQTKMLKEALQKMGHDVFLHSFPSYDSQSSGPVKMYLGGELVSDPKEIEAKQASALYAVDRFCTVKQWQKTKTTEGKILLLDRYLYSNMIHQAGKAKTETEREEILAFIEYFEFGILRLPPADIVIFLDMPVAYSKKLANNRAQLKTGAKIDIHERDKNHLEQAYKSAKYCAKKYKWHQIDCLNDLGVIKSPEEIHGEVLNIIANTL